MSTKALLITIAFALCIFVALNFIWSNTRPDPTLATLQENPGLGFVQMFNTLDSEPIEVTELSPGTVCKKLGSRIPVYDGGPPMYFYKLNCDGHVGYVNTLWVR